jgi:hypothetical protein
VEDSNDVNRQRHLESAHVVIKKHLKLTTKTLNRRLIECHRNSTDSMTTAFTLIRGYVHHAHCALVSSCLFQALYAIDSAYALKTNSKPFAPFLNPFLADLMEHVYRNYTTDPELENILNADLKVDQLNEQWQQVMNKIITSSYSLINLFFQFFY